MVLDHLLVPKDDTLIQVKVFVIIQDPCGSDHRGLYAVMAPRSHTMAIAALVQPTPPERERHCLVHKCQAHGKYTTVVTSNLCCQHGCNSDAECCDDAECRAKAKQAYVHTLRNPGSATAHEGLERCPGPRTDI